MDMHFGDLPVGQTTRLRPSKYEARGPSFETRASRAPQDEVIVRGL
jgi:hypothetical protein